ncbi:diguanylate cyclase [soil metagenome]
MNRSLLALVSTLLLALLSATPRAWAASEPSVASATSGARAESPAIAASAAEASAPSAARPASPAQTSLQRSRAAMRNDPDRSRALAEHALQLLAQQPDADLEVDAHLLLCDYNAERDRPAAQQHLEIAQALLPRTTRPALAAQVAGCEGDLSELAGDNARALSLYDRSVTLAEAAHANDVLANALYQRGYLRGLRGELANGLADLRRANDIYERLRLPEEALNTLMAVATLYDRMGDHAQARRYFADALQAQRSAGLVREQSVTQHNLGRALERLGDWPAARDAFEAAFQLSQQIAYPRGEAYGLRGLASVSNAEGDGASALLLLDRATILLRNAPDERLRAQIALQRGVALRLVHRLGDSVASLTDALTVFQAADSQVEVASTRNELAASHAALGDYKAAYEQASQFAALSDRLLKRQIEERYASLKVEFDTAVTDRENQLLKREKIATDRALAQEQRASSLRAVALALAAVLVALLAMLVLRHYRTSQRMRGLAMTDELTQLANRRHVLSTLQGIVTDGSACALLIADLDLFKPINDEHGHLVGDAILRAVAAALRATMPTHSHLGRLGGEEFIVLLPGTTQEEALAVAERARAAVEAIDVSQWMTHRGVSISIGLTLCTPRDDLAEALRRADEALYDAKRSGRNCVRSAVSSGHEVPDRVDDKSAEHVAPPAVADAPLPRLGDALP